MTAYRVPVTLALEYMLRPAERRDLDNQALEPTEFRRQLSETFIALAMQARYPGGLDAKTARLFAGIKRELDMLAPVIELDGLQWEWLADLCLSPKTDEAIKVPPPYAVWWCQWVEYLAAVQAGVRPQMAGSATGPLARVATEG
jgi:hypothetical protein